MAKQKQTLYDTPVKRLLRACGLALGYGPKSAEPDNWTITNKAWDQLEKWEEKHGDV